MTGKTHDIGAGVFAPAVPQPLSRRTRQRHATTFAAAFLRRLAGFAQNALAVIRAARTARFQSRRTAFAYAVQTFQTPAGTRSPAEFAEPLSARDGIRLAASQLVHLGIRTADCEKQSDVQAQNENQKASHCRPRQFGIQQQPSDDIVESSGHCATVPSMHLPPIRL